MMTINIMTLRTGEAGDCYYLILDDRQRTEALVDSLVERLQV